jgi:predicted GH43/DUF377 family glycosyl hydrolase
LLLIVAFLAVYGQNSTQSTHQKMMYADSTRRGKPFSKNPFVIHLGGRYLMYSSILPIKGSDSREIEITESKDLINWRNVGYLNIQEEYEKKGISAPCVLVIKGKVHIFYQTYGNGKNDAICHAVSDDGITNFKRNPTNPIFRPDGGWNCGRAIDAEVFHYNGKYFMYFATRDPQYKIQLQGVAIAPGNTNFNREDWEWNYSESGHPDIFDDGDKTYLFYQGNKDNGNTWWISNVEVFWNEKGPYLKN